MTDLKTMRMTLAPCCPMDRPDFINLELDGEVMRFLSGGVVHRESVDPNTVTFLMPEGTETHVWTARLRDSGDFVGWFCLYPETEVLAELGYRLKRNCWGMGLATEGALALADWGFTSGGYQRIIASTMAVNHGSRRVMEKLGMRHIRTDHAVFDNPLPGSEEGEVIYELLRSDWPITRMGS